MRWSIVPGAWKPFFVGFIVFVVLGATSGFIVYQQYLNQQEKVANDALFAGDLVESELDNTLRQAYIGASAVSSLVGYRGSAYFDTIARKLVTERNGLVAIGFVRDRELHFYPPLNADTATLANLEQEYAAIGTASLNAPTDIVFASATRILGDGKLLIGRVPILSGNIREGYILVVFNPSEVIRSTSPENQHSFQVSLYNARTDAEYMLLSPPAWFDTAHAGLITTHQASPANTFRIYVQPRANIQMSWGLLLLGLLVALGGGLAVAYILIQPKHLRHLVNEKVNELGIAEGKYLAIFKEATDAIILIDLDYSIVEASNAAEDLSGYSVGELQTMSVKDLFERSYISSMPLRMEEIVGGAHLHTERILTRKDGTRIVIEANVKMISADRIMAIMRDVTTQREVQRQIAVNEALLRNSVDNSALGIAIIGLDGMITRANLELSSMLGYTRQELEGMHFQDLIHAEEIGDDLRYIEHAVAGRADTYRAEKRYIHKNGFIVWVNQNTSLVRDELGRPLHFFSQLEDNAERLATRELIETREMQLAAFVENTPAAIAMFNKDMRYMTASRKWLEYTGLRDGEYLGKDYRESASNLPAHWQEAHERSLTGSIERHDAELFQTADGRFSWLKWEIHPWYTPAGEIGGTILLSEDITAQVEAERNYKTIVEQSQLGIYIYQDNRFVYVNPKLQDIYGYTNEELTGDDGRMENVIYKDDLPQVQEQVRLRDSGARNFVQYEMRIVRKDGTLRWLEVFGSATFYKGKPAVIGTLQDVTERKQYEETILHEKSLSDTVINALPGIFYIAEKDGKLFRWNKHLETVLGCTAAELHSSYITDFTAPQQKERILDARAKAFEKGRAEDEVTVISKTGVQYSYFINIMPILYNGQWCIMGIGLDFTDKKAAEAALLAKTEESEARRSELNALFDSVEGAASLFDLQKRYVIFNKQFIVDHRLLTSVDPEPGIEVYDHFPPEIKTERLKIVDEVIQGGGKRDIEEFYERDGHATWYRTSFAPVISSGGKIIGASSYSLDLTKIKQAEYQLTRINNELNDRVKELRCLYRVSQLTGDESSTAETLIQELITVLPFGWKYPEITCVRATYANLKFKSRNYQDSEWQQEAPIVCNGEPMGMITVGYLQNMPSEIEGPFLGEERALIDSIAKMIGSAIEKRISGEEIVKLSRLYHFTSAINEMILRTTDEMTIYKNTCDIAMNLGKYRMAWIGTIDPLEKSVVPFAVAGHDEGYLDQFTHGRTSAMIAQGPSATAIRTRTVQYCNDIANDPRMKYWREEALKRNYRACITLPIIVDTKLAAVFNLYREERFSFNEAEIKLLKEVTENIAYAIDNLHARDAKQHYVEKLSESEELFRKLTEETPVGVYISQGNRFAYVNPRFEELTGYSSEVLLQNFPFEKLIHPDDVDTIWEAYLSGLSAEQPAGQHVLKGVRADGKIRYIELITSRIRYQGKPAIIGTVIDITSKVEEEKRFSLAVTEAQENERVVIGMELHDNVKQIMATSLLSLYVVKTSLDDKTTADQYLNNAQEQIKQAISEIRKISHQLAPSVDTSLPFEEKLTSLVSGMNVSRDIRMEYEFHLPDRPINSQTQQALYRIVQEQFTNIQKYAHATKVTLTMTGDTRMLQLAIRDNGVGFDMAQKRTGIGIENIMRRAKALGGAVHIESSPGNGYALTVDIPFA